MKFGKLSNQKVKCLRESRVSHAGRKHSDKDITKIYFQKITQLEVKLCSKIKLMQGFDEVVKLFVYEKKDLSKTLCFL